MRRRLRSDSAWCLAFPCLFFFHSLLFQGCHFELFSDDRFKPKNQKKSWHDIRQKKGWAVFLFYCIYPMARRDAIVEHVENLQKIYMRESSLKELEKLLGMSTETQLRHWLEVLFKTGAKHTVWCRIATCGLVGKLAVKHGPVVQRYGSDLVRWWDARLKDEDLDAHLTEAIAKSVGVTIKYGQVKELKLYLRSFFRLIEGFERREQVGGASALRAVLDHMPP